MTSTCPSCGDQLVVGVREWHRRSPGCSYEGSVLEPRILEQAEGGDLDESSREDALATLRRRNFDRIVGELGAPAPGSAPLLDVGCAHGWFLERAAAEGWSVVGIEPDVAVSASTRARGLDVRPGFFPDAVGADERFGLIAFNDVLEHIPDVLAVLRACADHLEPGGRVLVNAPSRRGFLYRVASALARLGATGPFDRMWQEGFPSPHVHYFDTASVRSIASAAGFTVERTHRLPSVAVRGMYRRIRYAGDVGVLKAAALTVVVTAAVPLLRVLPSDIDVWVLRRTDA
ncbi:MAG: class I SAM-dependent methyltransferase [Marmoricola sp.]